LAFLALKQFPFSVPLLKKSIRPLLYCGFALFLGIVLQVWASRIVGQAGLGKVSFFECKKCNAQFRNANGVCAQGHLFYLTSKQLVQEGQPNCDHDWVLSGSGYPFGAVSPIYSVLIYLSFALFLIGALALIGIGISLCRQTRELDPRRKGHLC